MDDKARIRLSKKLSYHLRHAPEELGITLGEGGWAGLAALATALNVSEEDLTYVVTHCEKRRFAIHDGRIRANQGHSVEVDLALPEAEPPAVLYHGTAQRFLGDILAEGLKKMGRHHVHLSADVETAKRVGGRRGRPAVLVVDAGRMRRDGHTFYRSDNDVWLTDSVPSGYLEPWSPQ